MRAFYQVPPTRQFPRLISPGAPRMAPQADIPVDITFCERKELICVMEEEAICVTEEAVCVIGQTLPAHAHAPTLPAHVHAQTLPVSQPVPHKHPFFMDKTEKAAAEQDRQAHLLSAHISASNALSRALQRPHRDQVTDASETRRQHSFFKRSQPPAVIVFDLSTEDVPRRRGVNLTRIATDPPPWPRDFQLSPPHLSVDDPPSVLWPGIQKSPPPATSDCVPFTTGCRPASHVRLAHIFREYADGRLRQRSNDGSSRDSSSQRPAPPSIPLHPSAIQQALDDGVPVVCILTGPPGSGKTEFVTRTLATALNRHVIEINAVQPRTAKTLDTVQTTLQHQPQTRAFSAFFPHRNGRHKQNGPQKKTKRVESRDAVTSSSSVESSGAVESSSSVESRDAVTSGGAVEPSGAVESNRANNANHTNDNTRTNRTSHVICLDEDSGEDEPISAPLLLIDEVELAFDGDRGFWTALSLFLATPRPALPIFLTTNAPEGLLRRLIKFPDCAQFVECRGTGDERRVARETDFIQRLHRIDSTLDYEHFAMRSGYFMTTPQDASMTETRDMQKHVFETLRWNSLLEQLPLGDNPPMPSLEAATQFFEASSLANVLLSAATETVIEDAGVTELLFDPLADVSVTLRDGDLTCDLARQLLQQTFCPLGIVSEAAPSETTSLCVQWERNREDDRNPQLRVLSRRLARRFFDYTRSMNHAVVWETTLMTHVIQMECQRQEDSSLRPPTDRNCTSTFRRRQRPHYRYLSDDLLNAILTLK